MNLEFTSYYADNIYPFIADTVGRIWAKTHIAAGEIVMYIAVLLVLLNIIFGILTIFLRENESYRDFEKRYGLTCFVIMIVFAVIYVLNWGINILSPTLGGGYDDMEELTVEDIRAVREYLVIELNEAAGEAERDSEGALIFPERERSDEMIMEALRDLSPEFSRLGGYYPPPKEALCSQVLDSMDIGGYTYPYTMEITYNKYVSDLYYPVLIAHEECHHKGYYRENEAVFLGALSLMRSDDPFIRYAGLIEAYSYLNKAYLKALYETCPKEEIVDIYDKEIAPDAIVYEDIARARKEAEEKLEKEQKVPEKIRQGAKEVSEVGWDTQGKILDKDSYDGAVLLFVEYFEKK